LHISGSERGSGCGQNSTLLRLGRMVSFFSRNLGVQRLAISLGIVGCTLGCVSAWSRFQHLEDQRYWATYIHTWVNATPGSSLERGDWGQLLLVAPAVATPNAAEHATRPDIFDQLASQRVIRSFGETSPNPPSAREYFVLGLRALFPGLLPFLFVHAIAWIVTGFRLGHP
jgi:hypothetical protein